MTPFYVIMKIPERLSEILKNFTKSLSKKIKEINLVTKLNISYAEEEKLSSGSQEKHAEVRGELVRELRQFTGLGASFFRAAAARIGMTVTDMQVMEILEGSGPMTAGQLADLTGLTTGAITGMLNRLEESGLVRRERDPNDGRRVIVRLARGKDERHEIGPIFASIGKAWDEMASHYDDEQIVFLLEFLKRSNALSKREIVRLREVPLGEEGTFSAPLGDLESARFVVSAGVSRLHLRTEDGMTRLYQARFEGPVPDVKTKEGVVTIRYPRRLWVLGGESRAAEVTLSPTIPWRIAIQGGASEIAAELGGLNLAGLEVKGDSARSAWNSPRPLAQFPYGSVGEHQRSPFGVLQASPAESTSRAGPPHLSSTIEPSAIWATTCGCKARTMKQLPSATTSKSQVPSAWLPSPLVDTEVDT